MAVCLQLSIPQLTHTHATFKRVYATSAGLHVCQHDARKSYGRTGAYTHHACNLDMIMIILIYGYVTIVRQSLLFSTAHKSLALPRDGPYRWFTGLHGNRAVQCSCCDAGRESGVSGVPCQ